MNRKQRRNIVKNGITHKELRDITDHNVQAGFEKGRAEASEAYSLIIAYVMCTKLNYGEAKCTTTMNQIWKVFDDVNNDVISLDDIRKIVKEKVNINFIVE